MSVLACSLLSLLPLPQLPPPAATPAPPAASFERLRRCPLAFEDWRDHGGDVDFVARGTGYALFVCADRTEMRRCRAKGASEVLHLRLVGAASEAQPQARRPQAGKVHYFLGNDPAQWRTGVTVHGEVAYREVYPGIDVVYHGNEGELEYDFVLAPGADPDAIRLAFAGGTGLELDPHGDLVVAMQSGVVCHRRPVAYQHADDGARVEVAARFVLAGHEVTFELGDFDRTRTLVIDPVLTGNFWGSYNGGSDFEFGSRTAVDNQGVVYSAGYTQSPDHPTQNPVQPYGGGGDGFVTACAADGQTRLFSALIGGAAFDEIRDLTVATGGTINLVGSTLSNDFPTTPNAFRLRLSGFADAFVLQLTATGTYTYGVTYASLYGGNGGDYGTGIAADPVTGFLFVVGFGNSTDAPVSANAFQPANAGADDVFVTKWNPNGGGTASFLAGTNFGGESFEDAHGIDYDSSNGWVWILASTRSSTPPVASPLQPRRGLNDALVAVLDQNLTTLRFSTPLGGSNSEMAPLVYLTGGITLDQAGDGYVTGNTGSNDFPTTPGVYDSEWVGSEGFAAKYTLGTDPPSLVWSTLLGGSGADGGQDITVDASGHVFLSGFTTSTDFPRRHPTHPAPDGNGADAFVAMLTPDATALRFSATVGGIGLHDEASGVALDLAGNAYLTGTTQLFPVTPGAFQTQFGGVADAFVARFDLPRASQVNYGMGLAGTLGVPTLQASALPVLGTSFDLVVGNSLGVATPGVLLLGTQRTSIPIFGGTLLVLPAVSAPLAVPAGGLRVPVTIPDDNSFSGALVDAQAFELDQAAVRSVAMTSGLELLLGI